MTIFRRRAAVFSLAFLAALAAANLAAAARNLIAPGRESEWRYLDDNQRAPGEWASADFDDAAWRKGRAPLGFGEPDATTTIRFGGNANAKAITTYFRHEFRVEDPAAFAKCVMFLRVDDGALIYLNGREAGRINLPKGQVGPGTFASQAIGGAAEAIYHELEIPVAALAAGRNVLAIEVHQSDAASSDLFLDVQLRAYAAGEARAPEDNPRVAAEKNDPLAAGLSAVQRGDVVRGTEMLARAPASAPKFQAVMLQAGSFLSETAANRPDLAVKLVARAYEQAPDAQEVAYTWARTQLLARVNLREPFAARPHPAQVADEWKWIADGPHFPDRSKRFPRAQLEADLDYLETMIANGYSYAERRGADWRGALDAVRASLADETPLNTFTLRLQRAFTVFGDPHSALRPATSLMPGGYLPFLTVEHTQSRVLAVRTDRRGFVDADHPYLIALDGRPLADWVRVAGWDASQASPQYRWHLIARSLPLLNYFRGALGLATSPEVRVTLGSEDGTKVKEVTLPVAERWPRAVAEKANFPSVRDGIGYLRLPQMLGDQKFLDGLDAAMGGFRETRGLILDLRGNAGGTQDALRTLMPYFLPPCEPMRIVNVAAYRIPVKFEHQPREGFLPVYRSLHPASASLWSEAERRQIETFLAGFQPNWKLPAGEFSAWHVMGIRHETNPKAYHYDRPVILLSDAGAFSAGDNFLGAMKNAPRVTILGTASGGGSGRMAGYVLPNTKLALTLCQMASFRANGALYDGAGVEPDVILEAKPTDHLVGAGDSVLEAAMRRLKQGPQTRSRKGPRRREERRGPVRFTARPARRSNRACRGNVDTACLRG